MRITGLGIAILWLILSEGIVLGQEKEANNDYQYALIEAVKQKNLGNISEAIKLYKLVIKEKPECDVAHYELGTIYLMMSQFGPAKQSLEHAYKLAPENKWYTMAYLNALGAKEEYEALTEILKEKVKSEPDEVEWEYQLASAYFTRDKSRKALRILEKIEKEKGFSEKITLLKASIYEAEERYELARQEIEKVMVLFPEALQFRIVAAEFSMKIGEEEEAAEYYREILEIDSTNIFALTNLTDYYRKKEDYSSSFNYLAKSFRSNKIDVKRKLAIMSYYLSEKEFQEKYREELNQLLVIFLEEHPDQSEARLLAADFYIDAQDYKHAYSQLKLYLESNPGNYPLYMQAILLANAASLDEELIGMSDKAIEAYPDSADIRFFKAIGLYETEKFELLIENLNQISFDKYSEKEYASQSRLMFAEAHYRLKNYVKSDSLFEKLIEEEPDNYLVLNNYSYYLAERGEKLDKALQWSFMTIENNPDNATFLDTYAWVLFKLQKYEQAEKYILIALKKGGENDPEINEHAGDIEAALKSYEIARSYYLKAIILGGNTLLLEQKIDSLESLKNE